jgi:hypothetical protein
MPFQLDLKLAVLGGMMRAFVELFRRLCWDLLCVEKSRLLFSRNLEAVIFSDCAEKKKRFPRCISSSRTGYT